MEKKDKKDLENLYEKMFKEAYPPEGYDMPPEGSPIAPTKPGVKPAPTIKPSKPGRPNPFAPQPGKRGKPLPKPKADINARLQSIIMRNFKSA